MPTKRKHFVPPKRAARGNVVPKSVPFGQQEEPVESGGGFFSRAQSFEVHGSQFTDASQTRIKNVYPVPNARDPSKGLEVLLQHTATSALHNSAARFDAPKCDEDTRVGVIEEIMNWLQDRSAPTRILCMTGPAGTGKSALEQTISEQCETLGILAASFFFYAPDTARNNKASLITTIAYQISQSIKSVRDHLGNAVLDDPSIFEKSLETQIDVLLVQPLTKAARQQGGKGIAQWPHVIAIDALDECHKWQHQAHVLRALHSLLLKSHPHFRIFISSRPEFAIRTALQSHLSDLAYHIVLDDKYNPDHDIRLYLQRRLTDLGSRAGVEDPWPRADDVEQIVENASGQFIYAATVIKFVSQRQFSPVQRLQVVLAWSPDRDGSRNPFLALDMLYISILSLAQDAIKDETDDPLSIVRLLYRVRLVQRFYADGPKTSIQFMERLPFLSPGEIQGTLTDLHALVKLSDDTLSFYHKSFTDFLEHRSRSKQFYIDPKEICTELVEVYSKYISSLLKSGKFSRITPRTAYDISIFWLSLIRESTMDSRVCAWVGRVDFESWATVLTSMKQPDDERSMQAFMETTINDIHRSPKSYEWRDVLTRMRDVVFDGKPYRI